MADNVRLGKEEEEAPRRQRLQGKGGGGGDGGGGGHWGGGAPPPGGHLHFFWRVKNINFFFPATTEQNITRVKIVRSPR